MRYFKRIVPEEASDTLDRVNREASSEGDPVDQPQSIGLQDARRCMAACRTVFTTGLGIDPEGHPVDTLTNLCHKLLEDKLNLWLWDLYCCDSRYCGLGLVGTATRQDRESLSAYLVIYLSAQILTIPAANVDSIIDQCGK